MDRHRHVGGWFYASLCCRGSTRSSPLRGQCQRPGECRGCPRADSHLSQAAAGRPGAVLDGLTALVEASLLHPAVGPNGAPRFVMLETVRASLRSLAHRVCRLAALARAGLKPRHYACHDVRNRHV